MIGMKIEAWMLDGILALIMVLSVVLGMRKGIVESLIRLAGLIGGLVLGVMFRDEATDFLAGTPVRESIFNKIFEMLRPEQKAADAIPGSIGAIADEAVDKTVKVAADNITDAIMGVLGFLVIVLAVWLVAFIIRRIFRVGRNNSIIIGGTDRLLGMILGIVRGLILCWLLVIALIPLTTLISPTSLPDMIKAMNDSVLASFINQLNPLGFALRSVFKL